MHTGDIFNNKYILIKNIGNGKFSEVWLCLNYIDNSYVAMKIFGIDNTDMGQTEIKILQCLKHTEKTFCISYIEHFKFNGMVCIVQELMAGSLYSIMKSQYHNGFPFEFVKKISAELFMALAYIHDKLNIVHADIKPENILLAGRSIEVDAIINKLNLPEKSKHTKTKHHHTKHTHSKHHTSKNPELDKLVAQIKEVVLINSNVASGSASGMASDMTDNLSDMDTSSDNYTIYTDSDIASSHSSHVSRSCLDTDTDDNSETSNVYKQIVDTKYINEPHIVLADFGSCVPKENMIGYGDIQTRHYRSPEIILRLPLDEKIDIWAAGGTIYELITHSVLFDPHKTTDVTSDLRQLYEMQCLFGLFPKHFYTGRKNNVFFKNNFLIKKHPTIVPINFTELFRRNIHENISDECFDALCDMIKQMMLVDNKLRPSASQLLQSAFFTI